MNTMTASPILHRLNALGDETRTRLLCALDRSEFTVGELCSVLGLAQPTVSRHLKTLAAEGWVEARADGRNRHYRIPADLDGTARALWEVVRESVRSEEPFTSDLERAKAVLSARRLRSDAFFAASATEWDGMRSELFGSATGLAPLLGLLDRSAAVADLGAGTGALTARLAPFVREVVAVDRSPEMLAAAAARLADTPNVRLREGELEALPLETDSIDMAIMALVLHYVADPPRAFGEAARVLRPGGRLLVLDMRSHDRGVEYARTMGHTWPGFDAGQIERWLGEAGFGARSVTPMPADPEATGPLLFLAAAVLQGAAVGTEADDNPS